MLCKKPITTFKIKEQAEQEKMRNFIKYLFNENSLFDWFILYFKNYQNNEGFLHKEHVDLARRRGFRKGGGVKNVQKLSLRFMNFPQQSLKKDGNIVSKSSNFNIRSISP